jgi:hypothetical protein
MEPLAHTEDQELPLLTCLAWVALPGAIISVSIALRVSARKPLHDKAN